MRTIGVKLLAEVGAYKRGMREAKLATVAVDESIDELGRNDGTEKAAGKLRTFAASWREQGAAAKRSAQETREHLKALDGQIGDVKANLVGLVKAWAATGDSKILQQIKDQRRALSSLLSARKIIDPKEAVSAGKNLAEGISAGVSKVMAPQLAIALGGAAAAAAPLLAATVSAAVLGGVGIGGIIGGAALASKDVRVTGAIDRLGDGLERRLKSAAGGFVAPTLDGIGKIDVALQGIDVERILGNSAGSADLVFMGIVEAVEALGDAVEDLSDNAGPVLDVIGRGIAQTGRALADGLAMLSDNGEDAAQGLATLFDVIEFGIESTFRLIDVLTALYAVWENTSGRTFRLMMKLLGVDVENATGATKENTAATAANAIQQEAAAKSAEKQRAAQAAVQAAQEAVTKETDRYNRALTQLAPAGNYAAQVVDGLRKAQEALYGSTIAATDANQAYEASWDELSESVAKNGRTLSINTREGRTNRDALTALLKSNNESYFANIANGNSVERATKKHQARTAAVQKEAEKLGLGRRATQELINTYGKIPGKRATDLVITGLSRIADTLENLYIAQRAMAEGKTISEVRGGYQGGSPALFHKLATGGPVPGHSPSATADNVPIMATADEWMIRQQSARNMQRQHPGALEHINRYGELPQGYAGGGQIAPVEQRSFKNRLNMGRTWLPSREWALNKVIPALPPAGRTSDWIVKVARMLVPGIRVLSKDRPGAVTLSGNRSYHSLGRAVDFAPSEKLARLWNERYQGRTKELISPYQQYNLHNGQRHTYTGAIWNQHNFAGGNAHDHIAMANGGVIREPVFGVGQSGTSYSFGERGPERVLPMTGGGASSVVNLNVTLPVGANLREGGRQIAEALESHLRGGGEIRVRGKSVLSGSS